MTSLRDRQKKERRQQIIESARTLFGQYGYSKTNMDTIAEKANVGVATIYSYFDSKEGLVAALTYQDASVLTDEVDHIWDKLPDNPIEALCEALSIYTRIYNEVSYGLIRVLLSKNEQPGPARTTTGWIRNKHIEQVSRLLTERQPHKVSPSLDTKIAANIIMDLLERHLNRMSLYPEKGATNESLINSITTLFSDWQK